MFSFPRAGRLVRLNHDGVNRWSVANLEGAPAFIRGMIRSSMRKGVSAAEAEHILILTKDEKRWSQAVGLKQASQPVVVLLDATGKMIWTFEGAFSEPSFKELKRKWTDIDGR